MHTSLRLSFALSALLVVAPVACSSDGGAPPAPPAPEAITECDAYVAAYQACFGGLSAEARRLTDERARRLREHFLTAAQSDATRETTRAQCVEGARQLKEACR